MTRANSSSNSASGLRWPKKGKMFNIRMLLLSDFLKSFFMRKTYSYEAIVIFSSDSVNMDWNRIMMQSPSVSVVGSRFLAGSVTRFNDYGSETLTSTKQNPTKMKC